MGVPEMEDLWNDLTAKADRNKLKGEEKKLFKKLTKALGLLRHDPRYRGLASHEIKPMSKRFGFKVWQSNLESNTPAAGRIYWAHGPGRGEISILGIEPHPEDKKRGAYDRIKLSEMPADLGGETTGQKTLASAGPAKLQCAPSRNLRTGYPDRGK